MTFGHGMPTCTITTFSRSFAIVLLAMVFLVSASGGNAQTAQTTTSNKTLNRGSAVGLNPQPEPPSRAKMKQKVKPADLRGLNPQPEPPKPPNRN